MERDLSRLTAPVHDLVVIGGGIHGACIAWDAALRGLRVGLLERDDFGAATSANSLRIVHGGLRALARGQLGRMRESVRERSALLRIAPRLVQPLPVLVPAGRAAAGRAALGAALALNDLLSFDRNRGLPPDHRLPRGRLLSPPECRRLFPAFASTAGGALWWDAGMRHPERLTFAFVREAVRLGAAAANYCRADEVTTEGGAATGVRATDALTGTRLEVRARRVVVAAGPWTASLLVRPQESRPQAFALNVEVSGRLAEAAVGVRSPAGPEEDPIVGGHRFIFLVPQSGSTLLGTWYAPWREQDPQALVRQGAAALLSEFRTACPGLHVSDADVVGCHWGLLPLKGGLEAGRPGALAERPRVMDHGGAGGPGGMLSVEGVKYTTARAVAEDVVDAVVGSLGLGRIPCRSAEVRVDRPEDACDGPLHAQIRHAVQEEMAVRLQDVIRRTSLSAQPRPSRETVAAAARIAAIGLGWTPAREEAEIGDATRARATLGSTVGPAG